MARRGFSGWTPASEAKDKDLQAYWADIMDKMLVLDKGAFLPRDFQRWLIEMEYVEMSGSIITAITHPEGLAGAYKEFEIYGDAIVPLRFPSKETP